MIIYSTDIACKSQKRDFLKFILFYTVKPILHGKVQD